MNGIKPPKLSSASTSLTKPAGTSSPGATALSVANPMKSAQKTSVSMPKLSSATGGLGTLKSTKNMFKKEDVGSIKKPSIENLRAFLESNRAKRRSE